MAVGLGVPEWVERHDDITSMTDRRAKEIMLMLGRAKSKGFSLNPLKGIPGSFYRENRAEDIEVVCRDLIGRKRCERPSGSCSC